MSKTAMIWLIVAASLVVLGMVVFVVAACCAHWDFTKLGTGKFETNSHEISEAFSNISIKSDTADIVFVPSDEEKCEVVCFEQKNIKHSVSVVDGVLKIEVVDNRAWYEYISFNFDSPKITVYLPSNEYTSLIIDESTGDIEIPKVFSFQNINLSVSTGDVECYASATEDIKISSSTGSICVKNITTGSLSLSVSTGKVTVSDVVCHGNVTIGVSTGKTHLTNVSCQKLTSSGKTGDIDLTHVVATEKISIERSTGDVTFEGSDAAEIFVETDTGDVEGSLLTDKVFITQTDTGRIKVPSSTTGGKCEITTDTGNIKITIQAS